MLGIKHNQVVASKLADCLAQNAAIVTALQAKKFHEASKLRGTSFEEGIQTLNIFFQDEAHPENNPNPVTKPLRIGVVHIGACAPGLNTCVRAFVRLSINQGHQVVGIYQGLEGLLKGNVKEMHWMTVNGWSREGGAKLGIARQDPKKLDCKKVFEKLYELGIQSLVMIGGWDGYETCISLDKYYQENLSSSAKIAFMMIPASISNNLPGTDYSIGADSALNNIIEAVDKIKQSAVSSRRVFIIEVMGSNGYLAFMSAMATGANKYYIPEEKPTLGTLQKDVQEFKQTFQNMENGTFLVWIF
jgi:6-phosphofructokinase 1